jgi:hypothetical protein
MKKVSICIGFLMAFSLAVSVPAALADVTGMNGTWLKFDGKIKGMEFSGGPGSTEAGKNDKGSVKLYGCVVDGPFFDNQFFTQLYEKAGTATPAGHAVFQKSAGTEDNFAGWFSMKLIEGYDPLNPDVYVTSVSAPGEMKIKRDDLDFKGFGGQAEKGPAGAYTGYALYGVDKLDAKTASSRSLPFDEGTPCPAGNIIQVKKTDNGFGMGTITPAGPWVPVASNVVPQFIISTSVVLPCTSFNVYVDGTTTPYNPSSDCAVLPYTFPLTPGLNHSVWVEFFYTF